MGGTNEGAKDQEREIGEDEADGHHLDGLVSRAAIADDIARHRAADHEHAKGDAEETAALLRFRHSSEFSLWGALDGRAEEATLVAWPAK